MYHRFLFLILLLAAGYRVTAQLPTDEAAILRGSLRPERTAYDVTNYALDLELFPAKKALRGKVDIRYRGLFTAPVIQVDLFENLDILHVEQDGRKLNYRRIGDAVMIELARPTQAGRADGITIHYAGVPVEAVRAPWDGGLTWTQDERGRPWISVSCEGIGASVWWPNKDHLSDEPDSLSFAMTVPDPLVVVSNGRARSQTPLAGNRTRYMYTVTNPINNYNVTFYAGHYVQFGDTLRSPAHPDDPLSITYSVLDYNLDKAREHFRQVKPMLRCFESILGPYPFWADGYQLIEAPYLGMEHQSGIAYGNGYVRGYRGGMIPEDMNWDYLIIHETGHEYFGNALSVADHGEMWLHESFTTYLEALYVECTLGTQQYENYLAYQRNLIDGSSPLLGPIGINYNDFPNSDHYFKGAAVLHSFRRMVGDAAFLSFLKAFYQQHAIGTVTTTDWLRAVSERFGSRYDVFWRQYLTQPSRPNFVVRRIPGDSQTIAYFENVVPGFEMPVRVAGTQIWISDEPRRVDATADDWARVERGDYLVHWDVEG